VLVTLPVDPDSAKHTKISLDWKTGVSATNWDDVAKKENLDVMATELRKLEDSVKEIHQEMLYLRRREEQMRNLSGIIYLQSTAVVALCICTIERCIHAHTSLLVLCVKCLSCMLRGCGYSFGCQSCSCVHDLFAWEHPQLVGTHRGFMCALLGAHNPQVVHMVNL
jgi:hypothetical protein